MAKHNVGMAVPGLEQEIARRWSSDRIAALQPLVAPVHIDGRLQWWEWLRSGGRIVKTDAVDHSESHDLVGCQDILWDVAGASVELGAEPGADEEFADAFTGRDPLRQELLRLMKLCYVAFQLGWWSLSSTAAGLARSQWYRGAGLGARLRAAEFQPSKPF